MFSSWCHSLLYKLLYVIEEVDFVRGETVYKQGDAAHNFYIVYKGEFKTVK